MMISFNRGQKTASRFNTSLATHDMEKDKELSNQTNSRIKRFFTRRVLDGNNPKFDLATFRVFEGLDDVTKRLFPSRFRSYVGKRLNDYLLEVLPGYESAQPLLGSEEDEASLVAYKKMRFLEAAKPCDVILVRGNLRISRIIQTLTKSPYSHAAFYIGNGKIIESDPDGVLVENIDKYLNLDIRICRPVMLSRKGKKIVLQHMEEMSKRNLKYDITNIEKLLFKYWYTKFRPDIKVYIGGNTEFEKYYICSGLIAHGFHKAGYPVVPTLRMRQNVKRKKKSLNSVAEYEKLVKLLKKNYSQIVPGDFDNSPFFASVKFLYLDAKHNAKKRFQLEHEEEEENDEGMPENEKKEDSKDEGQKVAE
ncbi:MAG: hypothetical protein GY866_08260 [Proteobacteria bacterium]|nr:hypothetical protein [Pseudomonadota bacterium]